MNESVLHSLFGLEGTVAVITGGTGVLGSEMAMGLSQAGARMGVLGRNSDRAQALVDKIHASGGKAMPLVADVRDKPQLEGARDSLLSQWGRIDILVNAAGGNQAEATVSADVNFFDIPQEAISEVIELNLMGTLFSCQVFGKVMAQERRGTIVNISSMAAQKPLTRVVGYGVAKSAVENSSKTLPFGWPNTWRATIRPRCALMR
jgi:NAD(P)-dependent dehydrogenase (short-subunit alcohol dehydrogenase family)